MSHESRVRGDSDWLICKRLPQPSERSLASQRLAKERDLLQISQCELEARVMGQEYETMVAWLKGR
jgi:hypothetical protein